MSTTYTIIVVNNHGQNGNYAIFNSPPAITTNTSSPTVWSNVWLKSFIPNGGNTTVNTTTTFYAWAGTTTSTPAPGVTLQTGSSQVAQIGMGGNPGSTFPMTVTQGVPVLGSPTLTAGQGAFEIDTDTSFVTPNSTYMVGLGKVNPTTGIVSPVASILADNNSAITVQPIMKFYVATSSYQAGQVVNFRNATINAGVIDFSTSPGIGMNTAIVTHDNTGAFTTRYLNQAQTVMALNAVKNDSMSSFLAQQSTEYKRVQMNQVIETLKSILGSFENDTASDSELVLGDSLSWIGKVKWPATVAFSVAATGATLIYGALILRGYSATMSYTSSPQTGTEYTWTIRPPGSGDAEALRSVDIHADWNASVAADTQNDGHINEGIELGTLSKSSFNTDSGKTPNGSGNHGDTLNGVSDDGPENIGNRFSKIPLRAIAA